MADTYLQKKQTLFDKGLITEIQPESIAPGAASFENNFLSQGDKIELMRGREIIGNENTGAGKIWGMGVGADLAGTEHLFRVISDGTVQRYNEATELWVNLITLPVAERVTFFFTRTPAGTFEWFSSPNTGLYRINLANPNNVSNFYDPITYPKVLRGWSRFGDSRIWMWNVNDRGAVLNLGHLGDDWPYTTITSESYGTGDGVTKTFTKTVAHPFVVSYTAAITDGVETFTDDGLGILTGDLGGVGTINYTTGVCSVTFNSAPAGSAAITIDYQYEKPYDGGFADFSYSTPRNGGEGAFLTQYDDNTDIMGVFSLDGILYVPHRKSWWKVQLDSDDYDVSNTTFREGTGTPSMGSAISLDEGIYYVDAVDDENVRIKILEYNKQGQRVEPREISTQVNLSGLTFDESFCEKFGDLIIWEGKSEGASYNDTMVIYNKRWNLIDKADGLYNNFVIYNSKLVGGSSVSDNVYQMFTGYDEDSGAILAEWISNDWDLEQEELKKFKRFIVEGDMALSQEIIAEASYDFGNWVEIGRISGTSEYVDRSISSTYGRILYGSGAPYGSGDEITAYRYIREFRLSTPKFQNVRIRFRTGNIGYLNMRSFTIKDIRKKGRRLPINNR